MTLPISPNFEINLLPAEIADYVANHTTKEEELLSRLRAETQATLAMPQMQVGPVEGRFLQLMVQISGAKSILEIGTYSGYSSLMMARALPEDGKLITCDVDPKVTAVAQRYFTESGLASRISIRLGPALDTINQLTKVGQRFDLVFMDADKENYVNYWDAVIPLVPIGGIVLADNTLWSGRVLHPQSDSDHGIVAFNQRVASDHRVEHVLLSIRDGIMLARKVRAS